MMTANEFQYKEYSKMLRVLIILIILDIITTLIAFELGGVEHNPLLLYLSVLSGLSISMIVVLTHYIAIIILRLIDIHYSKIKVVSNTIMTLTFIVMLVYSGVVLSNSIQIIMRII